MKYMILTLNEEKYWLEIEEDNYASRQIILDEYKQFHISCMEECLAEGPILENDLEGDINYLTKQEFENVWQAILRKYDKQWWKIKEKYAIGEYVKGVCSYFYPQGTVIKGTDFIAIYKGNDVLSINENVQYKVASYDETNMWLIVE